MQVIWIWGGTALAVAIGLLAFWRGGLVERYGATIILTGWFLTPIVQTYNVKGIDIGIASVDVATLIGLVALSLWSRRIWTLFAAGFQFNAVAFHVVILIGPKVGNFTYITANGIWGGIGLIAALGAGVWTVEKRRREAAVLQRLQPAPYDSFRN